MHQVEYHHIPNFEFGSFGTRHHINIFFPRLWTPERSKKSRPYRLTDAERNTWYVNGLRPALRSLLGNSVLDEWPATCTTEAVRASRINGRHAWGSKILPQEILGELMDTVRDELGQDPFVDAADQSLAWAQDFFIMHTIRGVKHATSHQADTISAIHHLTQFFRDSQLVEDANTMGQWYIDVGVQIFSDYERLQCLQWTTSSHPTIVAQALKIPMNHAERVTKIGSSKYSRDLASHLTAISGFRITPGVQAEGEFEAVYLQAYTTDKSVTYNPDGSHHAKFLTTVEALGSNQPCKTIEGIHEIFEKATETNGSSARLEVRVPYQFADEVLLEFDPIVLRSCLCAFSTHEWW